MTQRWSSTAPISRVRSALPRPVKRLLIYAWERGVATLHYLRGKNILRRYTAHDRQARRIFKHEGHRSEVTVGSVRDIGVRLVLPGAPANLIALPHGYEALVARVSEAVRTRFEQSANCRFVPRPPAGPLPERTEDVAAVRSGEVITIQLVRPFDIDGLSDLCAPIMNELERKVYGSHAIVDNVYVYRSPVSRQTPRASWLWHYDNHPYEVLKVMIYLTDVTDGTAPFEYLRRAGSLRPLHGSPIAPGYGHGRIADQELRRRLNDGYESHTVIGPAGTMLIFDDNIIHRGNLAREGHRDVLVLQVRPVTFPAQPYISERWTESFEHLDVNRDPRDVTPHQKT